MSNVGSASNPNRSQPFDIWDFVHCGICYTTFVNPDNPNPNAPPTVPFWVTECGHVVCNNHLKPDKTCGVCGHTDVAVMAMSRDLPDPMSQWFRPIPARQEELAFASNVQQETVSKLLKHYRRKHLRYKNILAQMKKQSDEDRRKIDHLRAENERLRKGGSTSGPLQDSTNVNGKRRRIEDHGGSSSVASNHVIEPPPPERLTLPRDTLDHPPMRSISSEVAPATRDPRLLRNSGRASSPLDLSQYAFQEEDTQMQPQSMSHSQMVRPMSSRIQRQLETQPMPVSSRQHQQQSQQQPQQMRASGSREMMGPPPTPMDRSQSVQQPQYRHQAQQPQPQQQAFRSEATQQGWNATPSAPRSTHQLPQRPQQEFMAATPRKSSSSTPRYSLNSSSSMMPPSAPLSARLKASGSESTHSMRTNQSSNALSSNANMGPPRQFPPPGYVSSAPILINSNSESSSSNIGTSSGSGGHQRFIPPTPNGSSSSGSRRFIPLTPRISGASAGGGGGTRRFIPANTGDGTNGGGSMRPSTHTGFR